MSDNTDLETRKKVREFIKNEDLLNLEQIFKESPELLTIKTTFGTWLHDAARQGLFSVVKLLVKLGIDIDERGGTFDSNALKVAASAGHFEIVKFLLENGSKIDVSDPDRNPLFGAIYARSLPIAKLLVEHGIDVSIQYARRSVDNMNALFFAEERGETEIAELLRSEMKKRKAS